MEYGFVVVRSNFGLTAPNLLAGPAFGATAGPAGTSAARAAALALPAAAGAVTMIGRFHRLVEPIPPQASA